MAVRKVSEMSQSQLADSLVSYDLPKNSKKKYYDVCERCNKPFTFSSEDVKERLISCPNCGHEMVFFSFAAYDQV